MSYLTIFYQKNVIGTLLSKVITFIYKKLSNLDYFDFSHILNVSSR